MSPGGDASTPDSDPELSEESEFAEPLVDEEQPEELPDDAAIIAAVRRGDVDRFRELIARYQGKLVSTIQQFVGSREQAEELAHQTFVDAYRSLKRFDAKRSFSAWLFRIAINNAKDWLKSHKRGESRLPAGVASSAAVFAGSVPDPERVASAKEQLMRLRAALDELPYELREALILHSVQGLPYREMSDILGVTVTALKNRVVRGRARLREILGDSDD